MKNLTGLFSQLLLALLFFVGVSPFDQVVAEIGAAGILSLSFLPMPKNVLGIGISTADVRGLFTKTLIEVYQQRLKPTSFLRSFFPEVTSPTKNVAIEIEREGEFIAADVYRGTEGNRNTWSQSSEKIFEPPIYREYFDATQLDLYDRVLGSQGNANAPLFAALMNKVSDRLASLQAKIERSYEIQCAQVLQTGIITIRSGTNIDFKRKAASIVNLGGGQYFADNIDPFKKLEAGCVFLRTVGKSSDIIFNAICGDTALSDLISNTKFKERQNLFHMALDMVLAPQRTSTGAAYHGTITCGAYKVQLWSYPQSYDTKSGDTITANKYIDPKLVTLIPAMPNFKLAHAAVPQLVGEPGQLPVQGAYVVGEFLDPRLAVHDFDIQSAGIALPVAVDQIYTMQAVA